MSHLPLWAPDFERIRVYVPALTDSDRGQVEALIGEAIRRLNAYIPHLEEHTASDPRLGELAADVVVRAVARIVRNPAAAAGYSSESEGSYSYSIRSALEASADVWFPDADLALLRPPGCDFGSIKLARTDRVW